MRFTKVFLVDDHDIVVTGLKTTLNQVPGIEVIGSTSDSRNALSEIKRLQPHIVILDLKMPGLPGLMILRQIQEEGLQTRVLIYSMLSEISYVAEAMRYGAAGYASKGMPAPSIVEALWQIMDGRTFLPPPLTSDDIEEYQRQTKSIHENYEELSQREREILVLVAQGETNGEIANQLGISLRTVENHRRNLMKKMRFRNIADIVRFAVKRKLIV
ncbi:MAG: response regulator transcription factor [Chloroflexi bacterium]|nr:response regulator transcription factor [Chloroflexota bacterium]